MTYEERDGTCGHFPEQVVEVTNDIGQCKGSITTSDNNCEVSMNVTECPEPGMGAGFTSETKGKATWSKDGASATGTIELVVRRPDQTIECRSTYDVTFKKL